MCIMPFTAAENVSLSIEAERDASRVAQALKTAGVYGEIMKHELKTDAYMTKSVTGDGIVLSGGQQQKFALARALYKDAPMLILDEPTAALDPIAESEVYEGFHEVTGGKTTLFISHRLASTRFCDRILMLSGGRIIENGAHATLMALGGEYARMYDVQSHYYKEGAVSHG
jgi:ABC-type multidrug transport system fused ATPase/permease subunit